MPPVLFAPELKNPTICRYHAEIHVQRGDQILTLQVDRPDWAPEMEVLRDAARERGAETVGDLVEVLEREGKVKILSYGCNRGKGDLPVWSAEMRLD